jgi:putative N6-adenine-specific DNA methylase
VGRENRLSAVAVLPQGLEAAGCDELSKLGAHDVRPLRRAAEFQADMACLYRLHLQARLPFRLLREMAAFLAKAGTISMTASAAPSTGSDGYTLP